MSSTPSAEMVAAFVTAIRADPKDRIIHELAAKMLKTRYTPHRTNAWASWIKQPPAQTKT